MNKVVKQKYRLSVNMLCYIFSSVVTSLVSPYFLFAKLEDFV